MTDVVAWERVARASMHPVQVSIIDRLRRNPSGVSIREIAAPLNIPAHQVRHHMAMLEDRKLVYRLRSGQVEGTGAVEHFYALTGVES
jgi:predicted ArsR family transcriptional regulator